jgi:hypothetical protein
MASTTEIKNQPSNSWIFTEKTHPFTRGKNRDEVNQITDQLKQEDLDGQLEINYRTVDPCDGKSGCLEVVLTYPKSILDPTDTEKNENIIFCSLDLDSGMQIKPRDYRRLQTLVSPLSSDPKNSDGLAKKILEKIVPDQKAIQVHMKSIDAPPQSLDNNDGPSLSNIMNQLPNESNPYSPDGKIKSSIMRVLKDRAEDLAPLEIYRQVEDLMKKSNLDDKLPKDPAERTKKIMDIAIQIKNGALELQKIDIEYAKAQAQVDFYQAQSGMYNSIEQAANNMWGHMFASPEIKKALEPLLQIISLQLMAEFLPKDPQAIDKIEAALTKLANGNIARLSSNAKAEAEGSIAKAQAEVNNLTIIAQAKANNITTLANAEAAKIKTKGTAENQIELNRQEQLRNLNKINHEKKTLSIDRSFTVADKIKELAGTTIGEIKEFIFDEDEGLIIKIKDTGTKIFTEVSHDVIIFVKTPEIYTAAFGATGGLIAGLEVTKLFADVFTGLNPSIPNIAIVLMGVVGTGAGAGIPSAIKWVGEKLHQNRPRTNNNSKLNVETSQVNQRTSSDKSGSLIPNLKSFTPMSQKLSGESSKPTGSIKPTSNNDEEEDDAPFNNI